MHQLHRAHHHAGHEAQEEHHRAQKAEHVHRFQPETVEEPQRQQVQIAVDKAVQSAELRLTELARLVMHHLLAYASEARVLRQVRDVAVHFAVHLDVLHHLAAVSLQPAVEVVQVRDAAHLARRGVEKFRGDSFRQRVVAFLLVARNQVVAILRNHAVQLRNFVGRILQVRVHRDDHAPFCLSEAAEERGRLAVIAAELDAVHLGMLGRKAFDDFPRTVGAAVVHKNDFVTEAVLVHHALNPRPQFGQAFRLVVKRYDNGNVIFVIVHVQI